MEDNLWAYILGAGGGGAALVAAIKGAFDKWQGRHEAERSRNADMKTQRDDAYERELTALDRVRRERLRADQEHNRADVYQAYAARLRYIMIESGQEDFLPPWPNPPCDDI